MYAHIGQKCSLVNFWFIECICLHTEDLFRNSVDDNAWGVPSQKWHFVKPLLPVVFWFLAVTLLVWMMWPMHCIVAIKPHSIITSNSFIQKQNMHFHTGTLIWGHNNCVVVYTVWKLCVCVCENTCSVFGWMIWFNAWASKTLLPLYSKTCLQGTPQYHRERVTTWQMSHRRRFFKMEKLGHRSEKVSPDNRTTPHRSVPWIHVLLYNYMH